MLLLFGLAAIGGNALRGYGRSMTVIFGVVAFSLLSFFLLTPLAGPVSAVVGAGVALVTWSVAGWAITPGHQYRLIELSPGTQNVTLSLNASAIYLG
jgi:predicted MFS family arabinose efflux permease